jgi:hypothetical protein
VDWRAKTEPAKDAASVAYLEGTRASEDAGRRRFAAASRMTRAPPEVARPDAERAASPRDGTFGGED